MVIAIGPGAVGLLGLAVLFLLDPAGSAIYPLCLFHKFTGLNCPGCGSLRALHHLTHGEFIMAFHCNPLLIVGLTVVLLTRIRWPGGEGASRLSRIIFSRPGVAWAMSALVVGFGVLRNLPGPAFAWMSP